MEVRPQLETDLVPTPRAAAVDGRDRLGPWVRLSATFLMLLLCSWLGIDLSRHSEGVATIWLSNGLLFAIVIRQPRRAWLRYFAIGLCADTLADVLYGDRLILALGVSVANSVEVILSSFLLTQLFGTPFNLSRRRPLLGFLGIAVIGATALTSALGASWTLFFVDAGPWWQLFRTWYLGDVLGMAIIAPLVFILQRPGFFAILQQSELSRTLLTLTIPAIATVLVFTHSRDPLMFAVFPALLFVVFRTGFPGAVLAIFVIACIAISLTVNGYGPLTLISGSTLLHKIVIAQIFLAVALFTAFPVAALLEERKALELSLQESEAQFRDLANTDALTGRGNRRAFDERLLQEWQLSLARQQPLALLSIDVDLFKSYNDIYGHIAGDECLRCVANAFAETLLECPSAGLFRVGGEEFAVILPNARQDAALAIAERLRRSVLDKSIKHDGSPLGLQTISIGVATEVPLFGASALSLLSLSDQALYHAKHHGRNRSEAAVQPVETLVASGVVST